MPTLFITCYNFYRPFDDSILSYKALDALIISYRALLFIGSELKQKALKIEGDKVITKGNLF